MKHIRRRAITYVDVEVLGNTSVATEARRQLRAPLLTAFDIYKSNVAYGVETESDSQHQSITNWYRSLLDLEDTALTHIPEEVAKYVRG